jgi:hypothetical protein
MLKRAVIAACASRLPYRPYAFTYHHTIYRLECVSEKPTFVPIWRLPGVIDAAAAAP